MVILKTDWIKHTIYQNHDYNYLPSENQYIYDNFISTDDEGNFYCIPVGNNKYGADVYFYTPLANVNDYVRIDKPTFRGIIQNKVDYNFTTKEFYWKDGVEPILPDKPTDKLKIIYLHSNANSYRDKRIIEEFDKRDDVELLLCEHKLFLRNITENPHKINADGVMLLSRSREIQDIIESDGIPCYNKPEPFRLACDKWECYLKLKEIGIPQPETSLTQDFPAPYVFKSRYGALGKKCYLVKDPEEISDNSSERWIFQEYIEESHGQSIRVMVVDKTPVAWSKKVNLNGGFCSNYHQGGGDEVFEMTDEIYKMSIQIAEVLDLDYCGLDFLISDRGPLLLEVNSGAGIMGIEGFTGVNIAEKFVDFVVNDVKKRKETTQK